METSRKEDMLFEPVSCSPRVFLFVFLVFVC